MNRTARVTAACLVGLGLLIGVAYINSRPRSAPTTSTGGGPPPKPVPAARAADLSDQGRDRQHREWAAFRAAFPYHIQTIAASDPYDDGTRTVIVSEPPPHVTLDELKKVDPVALATAVVKTHTVGHDGWVKDVVFHLSADGEALETLVAALSRYLFATDYKAYCLPLAVDPEGLRTKYPLDLRVGAAELDHWLAASFTPAGGGSATLLKDLPGGTGGMFVSASPGVVVWVIPPGKSLDTCRADARRFALDSDLILGGVRLPNRSVVVAGRERVVPVDVLPPLRAETVVLLASARAHSLSQSYERTTFFAGKFKGVWDWAPAYLSPALIDTEYGSLLNIADQLLKSWTQHGEIRYQNFPYPDPPRFPFDQSLMRVLKASSLLFNWNTTGVGFVVGTDGKQVYALNRTGALPVIYRPDDREGDGGAIRGDVARVRKAEEDGYDYFATQNDPVLARVVQYAALYQLFFHLEVTAAPPPAAPAPDTRLALVKPLRAAVRALAEADDADIEKKAREQAATFEGVLRTPGGAKAYSDQGIKTIGLLYQFESQARMRRLRETLRGYKSAWGERGLDTAADAAVGSRDVTSQKLDRPVTQAEYDALVKLVRDLNAGREDLNGWADIAAVQKAFSAVQGDGSNPWLHTQTVVVSCGTGHSLGTSGGHNVDSKVTRFEPSSTLPPGEVRRAADGTIQYNPRDLNRLPELVRIAARESTNPNLPSLLKEGLARAPGRPAEGSTPATALFAERGGGAGRGFSPGAHLPPGRGGGKPPGGPPRDPPDLPPPHTLPPDGPPVPPKGLANKPAGSAGFFDAAAGGLFIEKKGGKIYISRAEGRAEVWNSRDATYAVCNELRSGGRSVDAGPLKVRFGEGYDASEIGAFLKTVRETATRYPGARPVVVFRPLTEAAMARLNSRVSRAQPREFEIAAQGDEVRIVGTVTVTDAAANTFGVKVEVSLNKPAVPVEIARVDSSVKAVTDRVTETGTATVTDLGVEIYQGLRTLDPMRRPTNAVITVPDAGDFQIVLDVLPTTPARPARLPARAATGRELVLAP